MRERLNKTIQIADTIHGSIKLFSMEKLVISTPIFNRLHNISQNSTAYLTFPTNRTKRFEHSIGTMQLCGEIFKTSISNSDKDMLDKFFSSIETIIDTQINNNIESYEKYRNKLGDRNFLSNEILKYKKINLVGEYNNFIPINVVEKYRNLYIIIFQAIRISALMHDVGHPPFSHITEYALKDVWNEIINIEEEHRNNRQNEFISIMKDYFEKDIDLHEQIGIKITSKVLDSIVENISEDDSRTMDIFENQLFRSIVSELVLAILSEKALIFSDIHRIIDGTLDGDRMDYVSRDPLNSGLDVGCIEYDRIMGSMKIVFEGVNYLFAPSTKNIDSIEDFFNRRWKLYKQIIYHHRVIKTDYLLQDCIKYLAKKYLTENVSNQDSKDGEADKILEYDISSIWRAIENKSSNSYFFDKLIQWDDGWLMVILKKHYFSMINDDNNIRYKLEELLSNKKFYYSLIKRAEDFVIIDNAVAKSVKEEYTNLMELIDQIQRDTQTNNEKGNIRVVLDKLFKYAKELEEVLDKYSIQEHPIPCDGFILRKINKVYSNLLDEDWLSEIINNSVDKLKQSSDYNIEDVFCVIKKPKIGIKGGKYAKQGGLGVYSNVNMNTQLKSFLDLSNVGNIINMETNLMPVFYLYIFKRSEKKELDYNKIKSDLGTIIGKRIIEAIKCKLRELNN